MRTTSGKVLRHLEDALARWEEFMWFARAGDVTAIDGFKVEPYFKQLGALTNYQNFRKKLLGLRSMQDFNHAEFAIASNPKAHIPPPQTALQVCNALPGALAEWTVGSRRVFSLSEDLQALLAATHMGSLTWGDIRFPFTSFAISLPRPIVHGGSKTDFLLVSPMLVDVSEEGADQIEIESIRGIYMFDGSIRPFEPSKYREELNRKLKSGRYQEVVRLINKRKLSERVHDGLKHIRITLPSPMPSSDKPVEEILSRWGQPDVFRIVIGLCFYLQSLPAASPNRGEWKEWSRHRRVSSTPDTTAFMDEGQICEIGTSRKLSVEEREMFFSAKPGDRKRTLEMSAHFRMGHWRRPPRTASNPEQEKTIWIHPTIVRRDRLVEGAIPRGSNVKVSV